MSNPARSFPDPYTSPDPIAESARLDQRRVAALLAMGQRALARLYLALLVVAFGRGAEIERSNERSPEAARRAEALLLAALSCREELAKLGFSGYPMATAVDEALVDVPLLHLEEHPNERLGAVIATAWKKVSNPHWPAIGWHGYSIRVEARMKGEACVGVQILFPDAGRSQFCIFNLCASHAEALAYAGRIATLAEALIAVEVEANEKLVAASPAQGSA